MNKPTIAETQAQFREQQLKNQMNTTKKAQSAPTPPIRPRWEYIAITSNEPPDVSLDAAGRLGWDLVSVVKHGNVLVHYFKRPL